MATLRADEVERGGLAPEIIEAAAARLASAPPVEILAWIATRCPARVAFATGFGAEGCVLIDLIARRGLPIDIFTLDTGFLFPETYDLWGRLEQRYGVTIRAVRPARDEETRAGADGVPVWERDPDRCCESRKVEPLRIALAGRRAWITAIRRDQTAARHQAQVVEWDSRFGLAKVNPLAWWRPEHVWAHIRAHAVPYSPLYRRRFTSVGCWPCTSAVGPGESERDGRWRGRSKTECGLHQPARVDRSAIDRVRKAPSPAIRGA